MSTMLLSSELQQLHVLQSPRSLLLPYHVVSEYLARRVTVFSIHGPPRLIQMTLRSSSAPTGTAFRVPGIDKAVP